MTTHVVGPEQHETRDTLGMAHGVADRERSRLRDTEQRHAPVRDAVDDALEIGGFCIKAEVITRSFGEPAPAAIVEHELERLGEARVEVVHPEQVPLKLEVADPSRRRDQNRAFAPRHVGDPLPTRIAKEGDARLHLVPVPSATWRPSREPGWGGVGPLAVYE
jgi:hypothetical protein